MSTPVQVYDKAEWHLAEVRRLGLPDICAAHHLAFMIRWLAEQKMLTEAFWNGTGRGGKHELPPRLEDWGEVSLTADMVQETMRPFMAGYVAGSDFSKDYKDVVSADVPTIYHAEYSEANYARFAARLDQRHSEWLQHPKLWQGTMPQWAPRGCSLLLGNTVFRAPRATGIGCLLIGLGVFAGLMWGLFEAIALFFETVGNVLRAAGGGSTLALFVIGGVGWLFWKATRKPR